jgi:hypothetical protein
MQNEQKAVYDALAAVLDYKSLPKHWQPSIGGMMNKLLTAKPVTREEARDLLGQFELQLDLPLSVLWHVQHALKQLDRV